METQETTIKVPSSWEEVTLSQYCELIQLGLSSKIIADLIISLSLEDKMLKTLTAMTVEDQDFDNLLTSISILVDIQREDIESLHQDDLLSILKALSWMRPIKSSKKSDIDFKSFTVGEWIDCEEIISKGIQDNIIELISCLTQKECSESPVTDGIHHLNDFLTYRKELFDNYKGLFKDKEEEDNETIKDSSEIYRDQFNKRWSWMAYIDFLAGGDITKYNDVTELNFLGSLNIAAFKHEKNQLK